jgi:lipoprotein NlpD
MKNNRFVRTRWIVAAIAVTLIAGCASTTPAPVVSRGQAAAPVATAPAAPAGSTYTVKKGDTLYSIARDHGMDYRELISLNNIESPSRISEGTVLKVRPAAASSAVATTAPVTSDTVVSKPIGNEPTAVEKRPLPGSSVGSSASSVSSELLKREPKGGKEPYSDRALALAQGQKASEVAMAAPKAEEKGEVKPEPKPEVKGADAAKVGDEPGWLWPANGKLIGTFSEGSSKGIDIAGKAGDAIVAANDGKVILASNTLRGYGNMLVIKHNNAWLTVYAHNSKLLVKEGQTVSRGQKIAEMGNSDADQVKLHFEVRRDGTPIDPLKYLPQR